MNGLMCVYVCVLPAILVALILIVVFLPEIEKFVNEIKERCHDNH